MVLNDDVRDVGDAERLRAAGFRLVRLTCPESARQARLGLRADTSLINEQKLFGPALEAFPVERTLDTRAPVGELAEQCWPGQHPLPLLLLTRHGRTVRGPTQPMSAAEAIVACMVATAPGANCASGFRETLSTTTDEISSSCSTTDFRQAGRSEAELYATMTQSTAMGAQCIEQRTQAGRMANFLPWPPTPDDAFS